MENLGTRELAIVGALAALLSCREAADPPVTGVDREPGTEATVAVTSQYRGPVTVYAARGDAAPLRRLGTVTFGNERAFALPAAVLGGGSGLRLRAEAVGSGESITTDPLLVRPGDVVRWTLVDPLGGSIVSVRVETGEEDGP